jgi:hypothetical protein
MVLCSDLQGHAGARNARLMMDASERAGPSKAVIYFLFSDSGLSQSDNFTAISMFRHREDRTKHGSRYHRPGIMVRDQSSHNHPGII